MLQVFNLPGTLCELVPLLVLLVVATRIGRRVPQAGIALFVAGLLLSMAIVAPVLIDTGLFAGTVATGSTPAPVPPLLFVWFLVGLLTGIARPVGLALGLGLVAVAGWLVLRARAPDVDEGSADAPSPVDDGARPS